MDYTRKKELRFSGYARPLEGKPLNTGNTAVHRVTLELCRFIFVESLVDMTVAAGFFAGARGAAEIGNQSLQVSDEQGKTFAFGT
jgi:hypothetical protein